MREARIGELGTVRGGESVPACKRTLMRSSGLPIRMPIAPEM